MDYRQRTGEGGGSTAEGEGTQVVVLPFREAMDMVAGGEIRAAKTIVALQHLALHKAGGGKAGPRQRDPTPGEIIPLLGR